MRREILEDEQSLRAEAHRLVGCLEADRRRLCNKMIPLRITLNDLQETESNMRDLRDLCRNLQPSSSDQVVRVGVTVELLLTEQILEQVMEDLDISDPRYSSPESMKQEAKMEFLNLVDTLNKVLSCAKSVPRKKRDTLKNFIVSTLKGKRRCGDPEEIVRYAQGLLEGRSREGILNLCSKDAGLVCDSWFKAGSYECLRGVFCRFSSRRPDQPAFLSSQKYSFGASRSRTGIQEIPLFLSSQPARIQDVFEARLSSTQISHQPHTVEGLRLSRFVTLIVWRLEHSNQPKSYQTAVLRDLWACLQGKAMRHRFEDRKAFVRGLITGQSRHEILEACQRKGYVKRLRHFPNHISLEGLKVGTDCIFHDMAGASSDCGFLLDFTTNIKQTSRSEDRAGDSDDSDFYPDMDNEDNTVSGRGLEFRRNFDQQVGDAVQRSTGRLETIETIWD